MTEADATTVDEFLGGRVRLRQPARGFRSGLDAVFLAAACPARPGDEVLEAGCGAGAASMCLLARVPDLTLTGIEADAGLSALAAGNARENGFGASFTAITADLSQPWAALEGLGLRPGMSDHTMANPPFYTLGRTRLAQDARKAMSRAMGEDGLDSWLRFLAACAKPGGSATLIHTADAVGQLMDAFARRFGGLRLIPLYPKAAAPAIRVIMQGIKGSRAPSSILPGIILHEDDGKPTASARAILRQGHGLFGNIPG